MLVVFCVDTDSLSLAAYYIDYSITGFVLDDSKHILVSLYITCAHFSMFLGANFRQGSKVIQVT